MRWRLRESSWKINLCCRFLRLSALPWCMERQHIAIFWVEWLGRSKCRATGLDASLSLHSTSRRCSRKRPPSLDLLPVSPMYIFLHKVHFMQYITLAEVHVKRLVILIDRLGPVTLYVFWMKGQVLRLLPVELKVPGDSSDFSVLLTKKSLMFLLRLNEMSGNSGKILLVSLSFWSNLKFFRMMFLTGRLSGWKVSVNGILWFSSFCDVCGAGCWLVVWARSWAVFTTE